jgi:DNA polymerase-3 subunit epsilon
VVEVMARETPLDEITFTVLDVETTGLTPQFGDRVCEIALLRFRGDRELGRFHSLVNPLRPISPGAFAVNGIRDEELAGAPIFAEITPPILEFLEGTTLVAHNAPFDLSFLDAEFGICGLPPVANSVIDTLALARRCYCFGSNSLQSVARALGLVTRGQHRALADAVTTKLVLERFLADLHQRSVLTLGELLEAQGGCVEVPEREAIPLPPEVEEALNSGGGLWLRYVSSVGEETLREVNPLQVTSYGGCVYLVAFCHLRNEQRTFRLDRIVEMRATSRTP